MKRILISALLVSAAIGAAPAFAQSSDNPSLTRAQVQAQLVQAEEAGLLPEQTPRNNFPVNRPATPHTYAVAPHQSNTDVASNAN